ncbi:MAG: FixH family protein [Azoarcus sp.]|jgi:hypothetical protein|nr:FixH family protein [Azoarcus sp.]
MNPSSSDTSPWYKQGWPWFLFGVPAITVVAGIATLVLAIRSWDGLVVDDYYKEGQAIVQVLDRVRHARELGLSAQLSMRDGKVSIDLAAAQEQDLPEAVYLTIIHPTRSGLDQQVLLKRQDGGYAGEIAPVTAGRWLFQIEDELRSWRMNGAAKLPAEAEVRIKPSDS